VSTDKDKTLKRRKAGAPVRPKPGPRLKLLKPQSECSTAGLINELSEEVKALLRRQKHRRQGVVDEDPPEAA